MKKQKTQERNKGITLIALVITIIVMLILVAVTISMAVNGGLFDYAGKAVGDTQNAIDAEKKLADGKIKVGDKWYASIDDYLNNNPITTGIEVTPTEITLKKKKLAEVEGEEVLTGTITASVFGMESEPEITWETSSNAVTLSSTTGKTVTVTAAGTENTEVTVTAKCIYEGKEYTATSKITLEIIEIPETDVAYFSFTFDETARTATITGIKEEYRVTDYYSDGTEYTVCIKDGENEITDLVLPSSVEEDGVTYTVTAIDSSAFSAVGAPITIEQAPLWSKVIIPDTVTTIDDNTFYHLHSLTSVYIPNSVTTIGSSAFKNCSGLTSVEIPNSVTSIGDSAFCGCDSLTSVEIPNSVTSIGDSAFCSCDSLTSVTIPSSVSYLGKSAFSYAGLTSLVIQEGVTEIGNGCFNYCTNLSTVSLPASVEKIGSYAFAACYSLTSVSLPSDLKYIEGAAFRGCDRLSSVTIPNKVVSIGASAFGDCDDLAQVYFEMTDCPSFNTICFNKSSGEVTTFYFKNSTVYDAFTTSYYNSSYGIKSTDYNW